MRLTAAVARASLCLMMVVAGPGGPTLAGAEEGVGKLRSRGITAYNAGEYTEAKKAFDEAFRIAPLHSVGVWAARTRVKLGEWVEAEEQYERLAKAPVGKGERAPEEEARQQAVREREELRHRLPRLRIRLEGVDADEVEVAIDGVPVDEQFLLAKKKEKGIFPNGKALMVNPGDHVVIGVSGEQRKAVSVSINEGQTRDVSLRFINPDTLRQRKCADKCKGDCTGNNKCYVDCKHRCFTDRD